jgi:hypothetical protein
MARESPTWGRRRIRAELRFLGYDVAALTVDKYSAALPLTRRLPGGPSWLLTVTTSRLFWPACRRSRSRCRLSLTLHWRLP